MLLHAIGQIRTPYRRLEECAKNLDAGSERATIEVYRQYADGLTGIEAASHLVALYWLSAADRSVLRRKTQGDGPERGVFANRSPARPNPIAIAVVKLLGRRDTVLVVSGMDCFDGTPLLDLKPYLPWIDSVPGARVDWPELDPV